MADDSRNRKGRKARKRSRPATNDKERSSIEDKEDSSCASHYHRHHPACNQQQQSRDVVQKTLKVRTLDFWTVLGNGRLSGQVRYHPTIEDETYITVLPVVDVGNVEKEEGVVFQQDAVITTASGSRYRLLRPKGQTDMMRKDDVPQEFKIPLSERVVLSPLENPVLRLARTTPILRQQQQQQEKAQQQQPNDSSSQERRLQLPVLMNANNDHRPPVHETLPLVLRRNPTQPPPEDEEEQSPLLLTPSDFVNNHNNNDRHDHIYTTATAAAGETSSKCPNSRAVLPSLKARILYKNSDNSDDDFDHYDNDDHDDGVGGITTTTTAGGADKAYDTLSPKSTKDDEASSQNTAESNDKKGFQVNARATTAAPPTTPDPVNATMPICSTSIAAGTDGVAELKTTLEMTFSQKQKEDLAGARKDARQRYLAFLQKQEQEEEDGLVSQRNEQRPPEYIGGTPDAAGAAAGGADCKSQFSDMTDDGDILDEIIKNGEAASQQRSQQLLQNDTVESSVGRNEQEGRNLAFGYFADGKSIYRNRLNKRELLEEEGHLTMHNLVLPDCQTALITTFSGRCATVHWLYETCDAIPEILVVSHCRYGGCASAYINHDRRPGWRWISGQPIGRGPRPEFKNKAGLPSFANRPAAASASSSILQHSKLLLFRSPKGLRIVVSGNNFTKRQWIEDRDCMWIQDIPVLPEGSATNAFKSRGVQHEGMESLRSFVTDLGLSGPVFGAADDDDSTNSYELQVERETKTYIDRMVDSLMDGLDEEALNKQVRFVYSFPRRQGVKNAKNCEKFERIGGWHQLATAVYSLREQGGLVQFAAPSKAAADADAAKCRHSRQHDADDSCVDTDDEEEEDMRITNQQIEYRESLSHAKELEDSLHLYAMSGSFGDVKPDFLLQMRSAMVGHGTRLCQSIVISRLPFNWSIVRKTYCLWPSMETLKLMNPGGISGRGIPEKHWKSIPSAVRQKLFFNAIPNPDEPALQELHGAPGCAFNAYHAFAHCKVLFATNNKAMVRPLSNGLKTDETRDYAALYVGSHNFSKKAWGLNASAPGNVEFGVVMLTTDPSQAQAWRKRLPCHLPRPGSISPEDYQPGSAFLLALQQANEEIGYDTE